MSRHEVSKARRHAGLFTAARMLIAALAISLAGLPGRAQTAPAGNEHPQTQAVNPEAAQLANPFGEPVPLAPGRQVVEDKAALARAVNLEPLRDLAVFNNGRVKILDTLARETVRALTGRKNYQEVTLPGQSVLPGRPGKQNFDPLFTFLDLIIDPAAYIDRPLIGVDFLPLRRAFIEAEYPSDSATQDRWLKLTRITPGMVVRHGDAIVEKHLSEEQYRRAISDLDGALALWRDSKTNLELVAPAAKDQPWTHLSSLPPDHPARAAALKLGAAWRAGDAAGVNAAVATLAAELPRINAGVYPTGRRALELTYNRANAFEWGFWAYALALVTLLIAFGTGRRALIVIGITALALGLGLHAFGFTTRCLIAERFAIQNQFESMTGLSLFGVVVGTTIMLLKRQWLFGAAAAGLGFLVLITATQTKIPGQFIEREAAILNTSVLLKYHVTTVLVSYGLITLGFIVSLFYLATYYLGKLARPAAAAAPAPARVAVAGMPGLKLELSTVDQTAAVALGQGEAGALPGGRARILRDLDTAQMTILQLAFWTLGVGILLGAWWADHSWGRWWAFDPKETWALITWIIYLIVVHVRFATSKNRDLVTAWLSVAGFIVMLWTYFGVNLLLPGLHAYA